MEETEMVLIFYGCKGVCHAIFTAFRTRNFFIITATNQIPPHSISKSKTQTSNKIIQLKEIKTKSGPDIEASITLIS